MNFSIKVLKGKRSDIEAKNQNETKTYWCVPEPEVEHFCLFIPKILEQNQNFLMCSNFFFAKAKRYYIIQKILDLKENVLVR